MTIPTTTLQPALESAIAQALGQPVRVTNMALLAGGASQETWRLDLHVGSADESAVQRLVLRRPLGGSIFDGALDLPTEYHVISAAHAAGVPTPRPFCLLPDLLGQPATLVERIEGESIGRKLVKEARFATARAAMPAQLGTALAAIHGVDLDASGLGALLPAPAPGKTPIQQRLDRIEYELDQIGEAHPALELCLRWLRRREPPPPPRLVLVHGDYRIGNMLVGDAGLLGVIDWEFAHSGDYAEDLSWGLIRDWRFGVDALRLGGIAQPDAFFAAYAAASGQPVDAERVRYWELLGNVWWALGCLNQARRHLNGEQHNIEFVSLGRRAAEMELEALQLMTSYEYTKAEG
ncbi:MAG: phosphotransferase family protein [Chloroflexaceae bacterium]|jgi:aminoglycoside phosphotransferase (APT) family kinase protein|nr:phosphotransferase family protein [Chloroflexaceae bacterium]